MNFQEELLDQTQFFTQSCPADVYSSKKNNKTSTKASTRKGSANSTELQVRFKTQFCKYWIMRVSCPFVEICSFAHGDYEIRAKEGLPSKYKTKLCKKYTIEGYCSYGPRCQFIHTQTQKFRKRKYSDALEIIKDHPEVFFTYLLVKDDTQFKKTLEFTSLFLKLGNSIKRSEQIQRNEIISVNNIRQIKGQYETFKNRKNSI